MVRLFKVIQYFPEHLDADSPADHNAQDWVEGNRNLIPVGSVVACEVVRPLRDPSSSSTPS